MWSNVLRGAVFVRVLRGMLAHAQIRVDGDFESSSEELMVLWFTKPHPGIIPHTEESTKELDSGMPVQRPSPYQAEIFLKKQYYRNRRKRVIKNKNTLILH
jgi:hypothetical protein